VELSSFVAIGFAYPQAAPVAGHDLTSYEPAPPGTRVGVQPQAELGAFLRARRDALSPEQVDVPIDEDRRVPGLRREEVAQLAGVTADYLRRLEQGSVLPSDAVLDSLADVFRLAAAERAYLELLTDRARGRRSSLPVERVERQSLLRILDAVAPAPAVILGRCCDVLAWNPAGAALDQVVAARPPSERNVARRVLLDPSAKLLYPEWQSLADEVADVLRLNAARFAEDARLAALVRELLERSDTFRARWELKEVREKTFGRKVLEHPDVGRLELDYEAFTLPDTTGQQLIVYTADPDSPTAARLERLSAR
jgi:transcriptional regulator with XRE-family HTH domain